MKLLSHISSNYKERSYEKFWVVLPKKLIEQLRWKKGQELEAVMKNETVVIRKV